MATISPPRSGWRGASRVNQPSPSWFAASITMRSSPAWVEAASKICRPAAALRISAMKVLSSGALLFGNFNDPPMAIRSRAVPNVANLSACTASTARTACGAENTSAARAPRRCQPAKARSDICAEAKITGRPRCRLRVIRFGQKSETRKMAARGSSAARNLSTSAGWSSG